MITNMLEKAAGLTVESMSEAETTSARRSELKMGIVTNCTKLNIRSKPAFEADNILCCISALTEVMISEEESTEDYYRICTEAGIEGYCMKRYITVKE